MERVVGNGNMLAALKRVRRNKGGPGTDGMSVEELPEYLAANWERIRAELLSGRYRPMPVKRVGIPKPNGGVRQLGIPKAEDRMIQQMVFNRLAEVKAAFLTAGWENYNPGGGAPKSDYYSLGVALSF